MIGKIWAYSAASVIGLGALAWVFSSATEPGQAQGRAAAVEQAVRPGANNRTMLPARLLDCHLGRITNYDPSKEALPRDYTYEGDHVFRLFLPSIPERTTAPPRSTQAPEPVDPKTRILTDPDGISAGAMQIPFDRVVDYWPERVEMTTPVGNGEVNLIILQQSAGQPGLTDIFMTKAKDAMTYDTNGMYAGRCKATTGEAALTLAG